MYLVGSETNHEPQQHVAYMMGLGCDLTSTLQSPWSWQNYICHGSPHNRLDNKWPYCDLDIYN